MVHVVGASATVTELPPPPEVAATFEWAREVVEARGWRYEVATEPSVVELENVRFLAGYWRSWLFPP